MYNWTFFCKCIIKHPKKKKRLHRDALKKKNIQYSEICPNLFNFEPYGNIAFLLIEIKINNDLGKKHSVEIFIKICWKFKWNKMQSLLLLTRIFISFFIRTTFKDQKIRKSDQKIRSENVDVWHHMKITTWRC